MKVPGTRVVVDQTTIDNILADMRSVLETGQLSNASSVERLESTFTSTFLAPDTGHAVAVNTGTGALEVALRSLGVSDSSIICPTNTYAATAWAILASGNTPVFAGCDEELQLSVDDVRRALDSPRAGRVAAVVVTHVGGVISRRLPELVSLCRERGILLVEDAAHAHGATLGGRHAGTFGDAAGFSLFATKVITSAEGGMAVLRREEHAATARILRDQGKKPGTGNVHILRGYNWRMSEPHAIIGHHHALSFAERHRSRQATADRYRAELADVPGLEHLEIGPGRGSSLYKYIVFAGTELAGVPQSGRVYEVPLHTQEIFAGRSVDLVGEIHRNLGRHRCLPLYDHMPSEQVDFVISAMRDRVAQAV